MFRSVCKRVSGRDRGGEREGINICMSVCAREYRSCVRWYVYRKVRVFVYTLARALEVMLLALIVIDSR